MSPGSSQYALSPLEEQRFGARTVRVSELTAAEIPALLDFCRANDVQLVIARCATEDLATAQAFEAAGGRLMDTLVYYTLDLKRKSAAAPDENARTLRLAKPAEAEPLAEIAAESFKGYRGHYHADPRLDPAACDEAYTSWVRRSVLDRTVADAVYVCEDEGRLAAFATMRRNSAEEGEGVLFGVAPWAQGRGIYADLIRTGIAWCRENGHARMVVSTQVTNVAVQKVWVRQGFEPAHSSYTFHLWNLVGNS